jgi:hypothetical protein
MLAPSECFQGLPHVSSMLNVVTGMNTSGKMESTSESSRTRHHRLVLTQCSKKPTHLSAPAYVEALMTWTQSILDDEKHFPQKIGEKSRSCGRTSLISHRSTGVRFPTTFINTAKTILRRLFRVYAHIYHSHFDQICALGIEGRWLLPLEAHRGISVDLS